MFMAVLNIKHVFGPGRLGAGAQQRDHDRHGGHLLTLPGPNTLLPSTITNPQILVLGIGTTLGSRPRPLVLIPFVRRTGFPWKWRLRGAPEEETA